MNRRQFRILYKDFLFRIVDRERLSSHAKGDASQLLLQILALLTFLSAVFSVPALTMTFGRSVQEQVMAGWTVEHFLIATTMLAVGVLAVSSWRSMLPDRWDVLVLGPLPIRTGAILMAKLAAIMTAL